MREERGSPLVDAAVARTEATYAAGALGPGIRAGGLDVAVQRRRARAGPPAPPAPPGGGDAVCPAGALGHADRRSSGGHLALMRIRLWSLSAAASPAGPSRLAACTARASRSALTMVENRRPLVKQCPPK